MQIIVGIIGTILSILIVIYRMQVKEFIGEIVWAETYFGPGGTFTALLLVGVIGFFLSLMIMTGTLDSILGGLTTKFFGSSN